MARTYKRREAINDANLAKQVMDALGAGCEDALAFGDTCNAPSASLATAAFDNVDDHQPSAPSGVKSMHELLTAGVSARFADDLAYGLAELEASAVGTAQRQSALATLEELLLQSACMTKNVQARTVRDAHIRSSSTILRLCDALFVNGSIAVDEAALLAAVFRRHVTGIAPVDVYISSERAISLAETLIPTVPVQSDVFGSALRILERVYMSPKSRDAPRAISQAVIDAVIAACVDPVCDADLANAASWVVWRWSSLNYIAPSLVLYSRMLARASTVPYPQMLVAALVNLTGPDAGAALLASDQQLVRMVANICVNDLHSSAQAYACELAINVCDRSPDARRIFEHSSLVPALAPLLSAAPESTGSVSTELSVSPKYGVLIGIVLHDGNHTVLTPRQRSVLVANVQWLLPQINDKASQTVLDRVLLAFA